MRAVTFDRYGPPEVMRIQEVAQPVPEEGEVLVRIHAAGATRTDAGLRSAEYFVSRFFTGLIRPKRGRIGIEFAGEVEAVGPAVEDLTVGDRVFGIASGTNAEYIGVPEGDTITRIPQGTTYEEAAGAADGALSGMSLLEGRVGKGDRVLVNGADGSIGVGAVQIAKRLGARVAAVCRGRNRELVRSLGADETIDYEQEDFTKRGDRYDLVLDAAGKLSFLRCRDAVAKDGLYVTTDPAFMWQDAVVSLFAKRAKLGIVRYRREDLLELAGLLERGEYRPVIDRVYPLEEVVDAHRYVDTHQKTGSVVLAVE